MSFGLLLLRLALGAIFIVHGGQKVFGWLHGPGLDGWVAMMGKSGVPAFMAYLAAFTEFGGGIAVVLGLLTRLAGLGLASVMAVAIWQVHWKNGFFLNWFLEPGKGHGYEYNLALIAMALCLVFAGAGRISIDALFCKKKTTSATTI
ncbi:MAG: DoxX family protein [bacterium]